MKLSQLFPLAPALSIACLLAVPSTGLSDHRKIKVYQDRDHDGHYVKKSYSVPHHRYYGSYPYYGSSPYYRSYPYGYGYGYGPSFGVTIHRSYSPGYSYSDGGYSDDLAVDVQRELRRRGYYRGAIDGDVGPGTRAAIRDYQYQHRLAPSGRIDRSLLASLGIR